MMIRFDGLAIFYPHPGSWPLALTLASGAVPDALDRVGSLAAEAQSLAGGRLVLVPGHVGAGHRIDTGGPISGRPLYVFSLDRRAVADRVVFARRWFSRAGRLTLGLTAAALLTVFSVFTWRQAVTWHDSVSVFEQAAAVTENNYIAHANLCAGI